MKSKSGTSVLCGECGCPMVKRLVAPCLNCGGDPAELNDLRDGMRTYSRLVLFGKEIFCDHCVPLIQTTDSSYWGFPNATQWDTELENETTNPSTDLSPSLELACCNCKNTFRKQSWIINNAARNAVKLPDEYWPFV